MKDTVDAAIPEHDWTLLIWLTLGLAAVPLIRLGLTVLQTITINGTSQSVARQLRVDLVDHLVHMPLGFYDMTKTGELMQRVTSDCGRLSEFVSSSLLPVLGNVVQLVVVLAVLLTMNLALTVVIVAVYPIFYYIGLIIGHRQSVVEAEWREVRGAGGALLQDILTGVRTIKSFTREQAEVGRWASWNNSDLRLWFRQTNWSQILNASNQSMVALGTAAILGFGGWQVAMHRMTVGGLIAFLAYAPQLYATCGAILSSRVDIGNVESYMSRVFDILDLPTEDYGTADPSISDVPCCRTHGCEVRFDDVALVYDDGRSGVQALSLEIHPGEFVAFVGPSGGGKSTILDLLMRFYLPTSGDIWIDGLNVRDLPLTHLRREVALVSQDVHVWNDSVMANIRYAGVGATDDQIREAVKAAQLEAFIAGLPNGYDTVIGERGVRLSGGERQRLSIARALLRNPRLLLLDEATAALDSLTERALQEAILPFLRGRTVIAVAHRLSTVIDSDRIIVIANHQIVQEGPHTLLVKEAGLYRDLYETQYRAANSSVGADIAGGNAGTR